jgi:hypothetical protein
MTKDDILDLFRQQADNTAHAVPTPHVVILELAQLLANSCGRLSKEDFDTLVRIGGALYKEGLGQFEARSDVAEIMRKSGENRRHE